MPTTVALEVVPPAGTPNPSRPVDLAKLDLDQIRTGANFDPAALGERARAMLGHIAALDTERAQKAILAGIYLHQVKLSLSHGEFGAWKEFNLGAAHSRTANKVMALAEKFCRAAKVYLPELVAASQLALDLEAPEGAASAFKAKLNSFVGDHGLTELYRRHGVIKKAARRTREEAEAAAADAPPAPASLSPAAQAYQQWVDAIEAASRTLLSDIHWIEAGPALAERVEPLLTKLASDFHGRLLQARHETQA